jgi:hypothetical protein
MSAQTTKAKLYYLPMAEPVPTPPPPSRFTKARRRLLRGFWRARLSLADIRLGSWRPRRHRRDDDYAALLDSVLGDSPAELIDRRAMRRKPSRPATILDFEAARLRLRPQTS